MWIFILKNKMKRKIGPCSSVVEHTLGKGEVVGSAPITGSTLVMKRSLYFK